MRLSVSSHDSFGLNARDPLISCLSRSFCTQVGTIEKYLEHRLLSAMPHLNMQQFFTMIQYGAGEWGILVGWCCYCWFDVYDCHALMVRSWKRVELV